MQIRDKYSDLCLSLDRLLFLILFFQGILGFLDSHVIVSPWIDIINKEAYKQQAQLGVPHSEIQVELDR